MKDYELAALSEKADLVQLVRSFVPLNRTLNGPCLKCGGTDRFYITRDRKHFGCRKCSFKGDAIDFISGAYGISLAEAISFLANGIKRGYGEKSVIPERKKVAETTRNWMSSSWQEECGLLVEEAAGRIGRAGGELALDYLICRGLSEQTIAKYSLGFVPKLFDPRDKTERPAISIPWIIASHDITGVKYRYIDELAGTNKSRRYRQQGGGDLIVFGTQALHGSQNILIIEGEINAMSVAQACKDLDVISIGGDSNPAGMLQAVKISSKYKRKMLWIDDPTKASKMLELYKGAPVVVMTALPLGKLGSELSDANDILQRKGPAVLEALVMGKLQEIDHGTSSTKRKP